jgi:MoaA/NifB/PqqE/SkfB family radical SAM enzyme
MDWRNQTHRLQVDITSHCNSKCAGCSRNINGGEKQPWLSLDHFPVDVWNRMCNEDTAGWKILELKLNGTWGDAGMHPHLPEMMATFSKAHPEAIVRICTNGGTHNTKWWSALGNALSENAKVHVIDFAIDGLSDTHAIYRRSTSYEKIIENARAFHDAGGFGRWVMTLFDHNIHQISEAAEVAKEAGFGQFFTRKSSLRNGRVITDTEDYFIPTDKAEEVEQVTMTYTDQAIQSTRIMSNYVESIKVKEACPWYSDGVIQLDPWGRVWPCCHVADYSTAQHKSTSAEKKEIQDSISDKNFNNLNFRSLGDILTDQWYQKTLPDIIKNESWKTCNNICLHPGEKRNF